MSACLDENTVAALLSGALSPEQKAAAEQHIEGCASCRQLVAALVKSERSVSSLSAPTAPSPQARPLPTKGQQLGRYLLVDPIGSGGMGVVYSAYDPVLERKVAVKVVREGSNAIQAEVRARLLREGKSIAQLAHPNVVAVFDMGIDHDEVFIAMELVEGGSLRQWLRVEPRTTPKILEKYLAAGEGLAAAHRAGLVHRDFKPENVLVGLDGRVRVTDFGLAASFETSGRPQAVIGDDDRLTQSGALVGTPAYMAPEQLAGVGGGALADQFSFCVSLWESLTGSRPFAPAVQGTKRWTRVEPAKTNTLAPWVRAALDRGLRLEPAERFPTMEALLEALDEDPVSERRQRLRWGAAVAGLMLIIGGTSWWLAGRAQQQCTGAEAEVASIWNPRVTLAIATTFDQSGDPLAKQSWARAEQGLERWWRAWIAMHTDACLATRVRGDQSDQLLDVRMACLAHRRVQVAALITVLQRGGREAVSHAAEAVESLEGLETCADTEGLLAQVPPPRTSASQLKVEALRGRLEDSRARVATGQYADALAQITAAITEARTLDYRPVLAEALVLGGRTQEHLGNLKESEALLLDALAEAEASRYDAVAAEASTHLLLVLGARQARFNEAHTWAKLAEGAVQRGGANPLARARLHQVLGLVHYNEGKLTEAIDAHRQAVALFEKVAPESLALAESLGDLGAALRGARRAAEAREVLERAMALALPKLGAESDVVATLRNSLASVAMLEGRFDEAFTLYQATLEIFTSRLGPTHFRTVNALNNLGVVRAEQRRFQEALPYFERVLAARSVTLAPTDTKLADAASNVGALLLELGRLEEASAQFTRARGILQGYPLDHFSAAEPLLGEAKLALLRRQPDAAMAPLERVMALCTGREGFRFDYTRARAQFLMGQALVDRTKPDPKGYELVREARTAFTGFGVERFKRDLEDVDAWLAKHPSK